MRRPTLEVVAARAGVSKSSVSRVINGETTVAPQIRDVVMRAVHELGYVPNGAARNLVTRRTDTVAVVVSDPPQGVVSDDPLFSAVVRAVSRELEKAGKRLVLMLAESDPSRTRVVQYIAGGHVDGVLLVALHGTDPLPAALARQGLPVVSFNRTSAQDVPYVALDNAGGAALAVRHLLEGGRRRIATITGPSNCTKRANASTATVGRCVTPAGAPSWHWATSPEPQAPKPCGSSWRTTPASTRCSRPTT